MHTKLFSPLGFTVTLVISAAAIVSVLYFSLYGFRSSDDRSRADATQSCANTLISSASSCSQSCGEDADCASGLLCVAGSCRNPSCVESETCGCSETVEPTATPIEAVQATILGIRFRNASDQSGTSKLLTSTVTIPLSTSAGKVLEIVTSPESVGAVRVQFDKQVLADFGQAPYIINPENVIRLPGITILGTHTLTVSATDAVTKTVKSFTLTITR